MLELKIVSVPRSRTCFLRYALFCCGFNQVLPFSSSMILESSELA